MRATAAVTVVASMILALVVSGTPASAGWCAEGGSDEHYKSCGFVTFEQCQQFVFGIGGLCYRDPWDSVAPLPAPRYKGDPGRPVRQPRPRRH
jgi:hypothetical protein